MNRADGIVPHAGESQRTKYFVVLGWDNEGNVYGGVVFNSRVNTNMPRLVQDYHLPIPSYKYSFLHHDSFVDCSSIKTIPLVKLKQAPQIGFLLPEDLGNVLEAIRTNPTISPILRHRFALNQ